MTNHPFKRTRRVPLDTTDTDGRPIVLVPLGRPGQLAKLFPKDFGRLRTAGITDQWRMLQSKRGFAYVRCADPQQNRLVSVTCLIMAPPPGYVVKYRDGDRTNLRLDKDL